ncbi:hypothetical protein [Nocardia terpenica]|nr:hypothetical protein [Nocardia terpenica]
MSSDPPARRDRRALLRRSTLAVLACGLTVAVVAVGATMVGHSKARTRTTPRAVTVMFGKPTKMQRFRYSVLYDKKPFPDAVMLYYDNGMYAILSEGEHHYGTYVAQGDFGDPRYTVSFISLPSSDWEGISVLHTLEFDSAAGTFTQQLINPRDPNVPKQSGTFTLADNPIADPTRLSWEHARDLGQ